MANYLFHLDRLRVHYCSVPATLIFKNTPTIRTSIGESDCLYIVGIFFANACSVMALMPYLSSAAIALLFFAAVGLNGGSLEDGVDETQRTGNSK